MRFVSNAFVVSTVALLSLMTPIVNANVAVFSTPSSGQTINTFESIGVSWTITNNQGLDGVNCDIALLHDDGFAPVPPSPGILQSNVPLLGGQGQVTIPDVTSGNNYFLQLLSADQNTVFAQSGTFSIV